MSNQSNQGFNFDDFDDLNEPNFGNVEELPPDEAQAAAPRRNPTFLIILAILVFLFLLGLCIGGAAFITSQQRAESDRLTAVAIAASNEAVATFIAQTATANALNATGTANALNQTGTASALTATASAFTKTPTSTSTPTPTLTPTETLTPSSTPTASSTVDPRMQPAALTATAAALQTLDANQTATALALAQQQTQTALALLSVTPSGPTNTPGGPTNTPGGPGIVTATPGEGTPTATLDATVIVTAPGTTPTRRATAIPDTGLFDDLSGGRPESLLFVGLAGLLLLGVIVMSRRARSTLS